MVAGDVDVALGFYQECELAGRTTRVVDVVVSRYVLSPIRVRNIIIGQTGLGIVSADQDVSDFVLEAKWQVAKDHVSYSCTDAILFRFNDARSLGYYLNLNSDSTYHCTWQTPAILSR